MVNNEVDNYPLNNLLFAHTSSLTCVQSPIPDCVIMTTTTTPTTGKYRIQWNCPPDRPDSTAIEFAKKWPRERRPSASYTLHKEGGKNKESARPSRPPRPHSTVFTPTHTDYNQSSSPPPPPPPPPPHPRAASLRSAAAPLSPPRVPPSSPSTPFGTLSKRDSQLLIERNF